MARRRGEQVKVYVKRGELDYGFKTTKNVHNFVKNNLGQTTYAGKAGVVFGANSPKPSRATKEFETGSISSFCSDAKIAELRKDNWVVTSNGSIRGIKTGGKTRTVYVEMPGGYKHAWNITAAEASLAAILGFKLAQSNEAGDLVWGVNSPKPPRAAKRENGSSTSTFIKPQASVIDKAIEVGFSITGIDYELLPNE